MALVRLPGGLLLKATLSLPALQLVEFGEYGISAGVDVLVEPRVVVVAKPCVLLKCLQLRFCLWNVIHLTRGHVQNQRFNDDFPPVMVMLKAHLPSNSLAAVRMD